MSLTDEQLKVVGAQYNELYSQTLKQLTEYKMWLCSNIKELVKDAGYQEQLLAEAQDIRLVSVSPEQNVSEQNRSTVSYIYEYPDLLHAWLETQGGEKFNLSLQGGRTLDAFGNAPAVEVKVDK